MDFRLKVNASARLDLQNAIQWYESRQIGLGKRFLNDFQTTLNRIQTNPFIFRTQNGFKNAVLDIFPYLIIYKIDNKEIIILAVFNTHKNPSKKP